MQVSRLKLCRLISWSVIANSSSCACVHVAICKYVCGCVGVHINNIVCKENARKQSRVTRQSSLSAQQQEDDTHQGRQAIRRTRVNQISSLPWQYYSSGLQSRCTCVQQPLPPCTLIPCSTGQSHTRSNFKSYILFHFPHPARLSCISLLFFYHLYPNSRRLSWHL